MFVVLAWTCADWEKVLFTDETIDEIDSSYYQRWVQRPKGMFCSVDTHTHTHTHTPTRQAFIYSCYCRCVHAGEAYNPRYIANKESHPPKVNAWACFSAVDAGAIELFDVNLDSKLLKQILDKHVIQQALSMWPSGQWWYLHDNDPKHAKSKLISTFLHNKGIHAIDFPPYSPDLNPIENLFGLVKRKVDERKPKSLEERKAMLREEWVRDDDEMRQLRLKLAHSMPERCRKVIARQGHRTDY
jgi:hypothetical protein